MEEKTDTSFFSDIATSTQLTCRGVSALLDISLNAYTRTHVRTQVHTRLLIQCVCSVHRHMDTGGCVRRVDWVEPPPPGLV